jgi:hypothetical protein
MFKAIAPNNMGFLEKLAKLAGLTEGQMKRALLIRLTWERNKIPTIEVHYSAHEENKGEE